MKPAVFKLQKPVPLDAQMACLRGDGPNLIAGGFDGVARRYRADGMSIVATGAFNGLTGWLTGIDQLPGGVVAGVDSHGNAMSWKGDARLWSRQSLSAGWLRAAANSPDGKFVAIAARDGFLRLLRTDTGATHKELSLGDDLMSLAWSRDGSRLAVGNLHGGVVVLSSGLTVTGKFDIPGFFKIDRLQAVGGIRRLAWGPDDATLVAMGAEPRTGGFVQAIPRVAVTDAHGKLMHDLKLGGENEGFALDSAWHPDGWLAVVTSGQPGTGKIHQIDVLSGKALASVPVVNPHGITMVSRQLMVVLATNANSSGNGKVKDSGGTYRGNHSVLQPVTAV